MRKFVLIILKITFMRILVSLYLTAIAISASAQTKNIHPCASVKMLAHDNVAAKPTVEDPREDNYDVKYVHLNLEVNNLNTQIKGVATTNAMVTAASMSEYVFELTQQITIDSFKFNGTLLPVTGSGYLRVASLPQPVAQGAMFTAITYYHGAPSGAGGFFGGGIQNDASPSWGADVTYTISESYASRDWWPVKQALQDKIDSSDVWLTVGAGLKAGSNGILEQVVNIGNGKSRYQWKSRNAIDYYLISFAVSTYIDYSHYMHFDNSTDSMLIQNYIYDNPQTLPFWQDEVDSTDMMINYLSGLFGRYPFWKEKYGHCMAPLGGGMEHQTMTTLGTFETSLIAHELGHQWFGDNVTCGTWSDIWLNEGFASYIEYLFNANFHSAAAATDKMNDVHTNVMSQAGGSVYCTDTTDENRIFSSRLSYDKGSAVIHTLRFVAADDNLFFDMLKHYQVQFERGTATTEQFRQFVADEYNLDMDTFFTQWIYGEGYPTISAKWNQVNSQVTVELSQQTSVPASVSYFSTPLELKLRSATGDTIVKVNFNAVSKTFTFSWNKSMNGLSIDPNNWILNKTGTIEKDPALSINELQTSSFVVYPNPANSVWNVRNLPEGCDMVLSDISGRILMNIKAGNKTEASIDSGLLPDGVYLLRIFKEGHSSNALKLIKMH
jgi:aminopeptidase N